MRLAVIAVFLAALTGCTATDEQRTREQAKETGAVVKRDAREALHEAKIDTEKATKKIDKGLEDTRDKVRKALDK